MPHFMDIHRLPDDVTPDKLRDAHYADVATQGKYGVTYHGYWYDNERQTVVCFAEGPSREACEAVHREAHGLVADSIIQVNAQSIDAFLGGGILAPSGEALLQDGTPDTGLRVVVFTQLDNLATVGSRLGDAAAMTVLADHDRIVRKALVEYRGREVQHTGDGMMLSFASASLAVQFAQAIQTTIADAAHDGAAAPLLRIGMAAGEPVAKHQSLFGVAVDQARAICRTAKAGEILVSSAVRDLCAGKGLKFGTPSVVRLPGIEDPVVVSPVGVDTQPGAASPLPMLDDSMLSARESQLQRLTLHLGTRYSIVRELGRGGMATIFLARDLRHDRPVAIKVLRPELAEVVGAERFLREIRVAAGLTHPNIVSLYDSGGADDVLYFVMPHLSGDTLRAFIDRHRQLDINQSLVIARTMALAIDYAHRQGVIHRDIKPENILLHEGQPMLLDFGIALALTHAGGDRLTQPGFAVGTPAYVSPEQAAGDREIDGRADIYALGCILYEMLAGDPPFTGTNIQGLMARIMNSPPPRLGDVRSGIPSHVEAALERALAKVPADRFNTANEFALALDG